MRKVSLVWNILFAFTGTCLIIASAMSFEDVFTERQGRPLAQLDADASHAYKIRRFKLNKGRYVLPVLHKRNPRVAKSPDMNGTAFIRNAAHLKLDTSCKADALSATAEDSNLQGHCTRPN